MPPNEQYVPLSIVQKWFSNLKQKMDINPRYLQEL